MPDIKATCAITGKEFTISQQEQELRAKFGLEGILPKMSPLERMRTLMTHRIQHGFWRNKSVATGNDMLTMYPASTVFPVMEIEEWLSDKYSGLEYAREIDWDRSLYDQLWELWCSVPRPHHSKVNCENCDFSNNMTNCKDCYYVFGAYGCENVYLADTLNSVKDSIDCFYVTNIELCYHCVDCHKNCYQCGYCLSCKSCTDCLGCVDCRSCKNCLLCSGLEHQKFCYKNEQLSEEEYKAKLAEYKQDWSRLQTEYEQLRTSHQYDTNLNIENSSGAYLTNVKDCQQCYSCAEAENMCNCLIFWPGNDNLDCAYFGMRTNLCFACASCGNDIYNMFGCTYCYQNASDLMYCSYCQHGTSDCMLSVGLNKKERFCILNKQYTEEEYNELKPRLIEKMKEEGWYGEPIPISWGSNAYNQSVAYDFLPLAQEEVESRGVRWEEPEDMVSVEGAEVAGDEIVTAEDVTKLNGKVIKCERTGRPFKLIAAELNLYARHGLTLPKLHPDERYRDRVKQMVSLESVFN